MSKPSRRPGREEIKEQKRKKTRSKGTASTATGRGIDFETEINPLKLYEFLRQS
jgi:hypothetical protein